jgi:hypothetical protein
MSRRVLRLSLFTLALFALVAATATANDIPLTNWPVPSSNGPRGITANTHLNGVPFTAVTPCRVVDTRLANGPFGGPFMTAGSTRSFDLNSGSPCAGELPTAGIRAYSLNFTVTGTDRNGHLSTGPTGSNPAASFSTLNYGVGATLANAAIVKPDTAGSIDVFVVAQLHLIIDINGFYSDTLSGSGTSSR